MSYRNRFSKVWKPLDVQFQVWIPKWLLCSHVASSPTANTAIPVLHLCRVLSWHSQCHMCNHFFVRGMEEQSLDSKPVSHSVNLSIDVFKALEWRVKVWRSFLLFSPPSRSGLKCLAGKSRKDMNSTWMQRGSATDLCICCMQKKKWFSICLPHPHSASYLRDSITWH